jgi:hypothetical protein
MKKLIVLLLVILVLAGMWYAWHGRRNVEPLPRLRSMMLDEGAPRPLNPSVALQINDAQEAAIFTETPLWLTVGINNPAAVNEASAAQARSKKEPAQAQNKQPRIITIGDATRPWNTAIELIIPDGYGGVLKLQTLMPSPGSSSPTIELNSMTSAEAVYGTVSAHLAPGDYTITAWLGETGSWKGRVSSNTVKLKVVSRPTAFSPEQELEIARQTGRFGLLAEDPQSLETSGSRMLAADENSIQGHIYVGEAMYLQGKLEEALEQFTMARSEFTRQHPNAYERPKALNARISQILEKL